MTRCPNLQNLIGNIYRKHCIYSPKISVVHYKLSTLAWVHLKHGMPRIFEVGFINAEHNGLQLHNIQCVSRP